jgi:hypothetical protein
VSTPVRRQHERPESPDSRIDASRPPSRRHRQWRSPAIGYPVTVAGPPRTRTGFLRYRSPVMLSYAPPPRQRGPPDGSPHHPPTPPRSPPPARHAVPHAAPAPRPRRHARRRA